MYLWPFFVWVIGNFIILPLALAYLFQWWDRRTGKDKDRWRG